MTHYSGKSRDKQVLPAFVTYIARESGDKKSTIAEMLTLAKILGPSLLRTIDEHRFSKQVGKDLGKVATEAERIALVEKLAEMQRTVKPGRRADLTVAAAHYEIDRDVRTTACEKTVLTSNDAQVFQSKMQKYTGLANNSIDAVITDPLYHKKHLHLYGAAAKMSARVLKPGGFAAFYCGRLYVDTVMGHLGKHLKFRSFITIHHKEHFGNIGSTMLSADCKHILVYQKDGADVDFYVSQKGSVEGTGQEKGNHEYEQTVTDLDNLIDAITQPGEVILDMFAGSGTTGVAAIRKARKIILIEKEEVHCNTCRARLSDALKQRTNPVAATASLSASCLRLADKSTNESDCLPVAM